MSSSRTLVVTLSLTGLVALGAYAWYVQRGANPGSSPPPAASQSPTAVAVETVAVVSVSMPDEASAVGSLRSNESVVLRPEVSGRISAIHFREGRPVRQGEVLVELDAAVQRAELQQARANLVLANSNYRRSADLFERNFVSQSAREEAASQLAVARAATQLAQARLDRMRIVAPFAGTIGIRNISVGDYVKDGDALVNLEDISILKVDFRLPESYLQRLRPGQALEVSSDTLPGEHFPATLDVIDPLVDAQGRAVVVRAKLANHEGRLRPGMFARVRLILAERSDVSVVPEEALLPAPGDTQFVYQVVDGKARRVEVRTGARRNAHVEIVDGLRPGDVVVTAGQLKLRDGVEVRTLSGPLTPATASDGDARLDGIAAVPG